MIRAALAALLLALPLSAVADPYDTAIGQVAAAIQIARACPGFALIGAGGEQGFVPAATELLKADGLKPNRFKKFWFYGQTGWIEQMKTEALTARGINGANRPALCALGRRVAGTGDPIGRFLVRK